MNHLIELEEKNYAECFSINLEQYKIRDFKTKSFLIYSLEYKENTLYAKKPFKSLSVDVNSIQYFAVSTSYKNYDMNIWIITDSLCISFYSSRRKIGSDYLVLNLLKKNIPQITFDSAYAYRKACKLKKFNMN